MARLLLLLGLLLAGRAGASDQPVVVATTERLPMAYVENGRLTGVLVDLTQEVFRRVGRPLDFRVLPWPRCVAEARSGGIDAALTMFRTPEREAQFAFTQEELLPQKQSLFVGKDGPRSFTGDLTSFAGKRIGVVYKTSYGPLVDQALTSGLFGSIETEPNMTDLVKMLVHGRIDVMPGDPERIWGAAASAGLSDEIRELRPPVEIIPGYMAFTRARDMSALVQSVDRALRAMKADGTYAMILSKYPAP